MLKYENMNSKKLFEILTLVNSVKSSRWNDVRKIVEIFSNQNNKVFCEVSIYDGDNLGNSKKTLDV